MFNGQSAKGRAGAVPNAPAAAPDRPVAIEIDRAEKKPPLGPQPASTGTRPTPEEMMSALRRLRRSMGGSTEPERVVDQIIEAEGERSLRRAIKRSST